MSSINDVAELANVSISTVSRVINNSSRVSDEKRKAVLKAISELNYIPNGLAQGLVTKSSKSIAILISDISNLYYSSLVKSIEDVLSNKNYHTVIGNTYWDKDKEKEYLKYLIQKQIDGIILASTSLNKEYIEKLSKRDIPIIVLNRDMKSQEVDEVRINDYKGGYIATEHLIKSGYKKFVHFAGPHAITSAEQRKNGFLKCLEDYGVSQDKITILQGNFSGKSGEGNMINYMQNNDINKPVGIFAANDAMAFGALNVLKNSQIECPDRIGLVGFDGVDFTEYSSPPLTTVVRPVSEMGKLTATIMLERVENKGKDYFKTDIEMDVKLLVRGSTRKLND